HAFEMKLALLIGLECAQAAGLEYVQRVGRIAVVEQRRAAGHGEPFQLRRQRRQLGIVEMTKQRQLTQQFARVVLFAVGLCFVHPRPLPVAAHANANVPSSCLIDSRESLDFGAALHHVCTIPPGFSSWPIPTHCSTTPRCRRSRPSGRSTYCLRSRPHSPITADASMHWSPTRSRAHSWPRCCRRRRWTTNCSASGR